MAKGPHSLILAHLHFDPFGRLASGGADATVRRWHPASGRN